MSALINGLPPEAVVWQQDSSGWTQQHEMAAALLELVDFWGRQGAVLHGLPKHKLPKPIRVLRPGEMERPALETDPRAIAAFFARHVK